MKPYCTNDVSTLYHADAREIPLPDRSVHCVVTSPPYWGLRDYGLGQWQGGDAECGHKLLAKNRQKEHGLKDRLPGTAAYGGNAQEAWPNNTCGLCGAVNTPAGIGLEPTLGEWVANIVAVMREVRRVLRDDGTVWLNLGDAYSSNPSNGRGGGSTLGGGSPHLSGSNRDGSGLPLKNLMGQPWRVAFALQDDGADVASVRALERVRDELLDAYEDEPLPGKVKGVLDRLEQEWIVAKRDSWILRSATVWHKPNPMPESATDRPTSSYEMVFLLVKQGRYFYDAEAVREPGKSHNGQAGTFSRSGLVSEHIIPGQSSAEHRPRTDRVPSGANARNVWTIATQPRKDAHFATFPDALPRRCILAGTSEKGVCGECGAPWVRQVEAKGGTIGRGWHDHKDDLNQGQRSGGMSLEDSNDGNGKYERQTLGWQPTCICDADVMPATVLDPFVGSGTTVAVAQGLGRRGVGLDLNEEYLDIAAKRIGSVPLPLTV